MNDDLERDLSQLLGALADRSDDVAPSSAAHVVRRARRRIRRRRVAATATGAVLAATAIVVAAVVGRTHDTPRRVELLPTETSVPDLSTSIVTTSPTIAVNDGTGPVVDVDDPPPMFTPRPFASIDMASAGSPNGRRAIAVTPQGAVVVDPDTRQALVVNEATGAVDRVSIAVAPSEIVVTGNVLYGLVWGEQLPPTLQMVAIPLIGPQTGRVVATASLDPVVYTEDPVGRFGQGPNGIVDRMSSTTVIAYVNADGTQSTLTRSVGQLTQSGSTITSSDGNSWSLEIRRHEDAATPFEGDSPPAWSTDSEAVIWTSIGPRSDPGADFGTPTMQVVATLRPDGSVRWMRLPDDWHVVSSDTAGVMLARERTGTIELARFSDLTLDVEPITVIVGDVTLVFGLWPDGYQPSLFESRHGPGTHGGTYSSGLLTKTGGPAAHPISVAVTRGRDEVIAAMTNPPDAVSPLEPTQLELDGARVYRNVDPLLGTTTVFTWSPQPDLAIAVGVPLTFAPGTASTFIASISASW